MNSQSRQQQIEAMLAEEPNDPELHYMLAMEHVSQLDDVAAVRCFTALLAMAPAYVPAYHQAGRALHRLGRLAEARDVLQRGIAVAMHQGEAYTASEMQGLLDMLD